ncbi:hypothetical protein [Collimonas sp.]|uniref:hypothetical protein n=1 Tax=Collimonas sp. TaxID=1963772 RepID=UPI002CC69D8C|nr:hypothetical protein [Collimonas sp.]HWX02908.1 hypothetical protein [Collimonas sp.]
MFGLFKRNQSAELPAPITQPENSPVVTEIELRRRYRFQYEDSVLATQSCLYLLLGKESGKVLALKFPFATFKYGAPNDEARGAHPLARYGRFLYGMYSVENSPWILEQKTANRVHPRHSDSMFEDKKHYLICLKDVTLDISCRNFEEIELRAEDIFSIVQEQLNDLPED